MADSCITKKALASSMKALASQMPFEKITIMDICDRCQMHRKSFYYHFKDKYDLMNWIFDTEVAALGQGLNQPETEADHWLFMERFCDYFYDNRQFYRKILRVTGQNSFPDHFREYMVPMIQERLRPVFGEEPVDDFYVDFLADAVMCCLMRWLSNRDCMPPHEFLLKLKTIATISAEAASRDLPA